MYRKIIDKNLKNCVYLLETCPCRNERLKYRLLRPCEEVHPRVCSKLEGFCGVCWELRSGPGYLVATADPGEDPVRNPGRRDGAGDPNPPTS